MPFAVRPRVLAPLVAATLATGALAAGTASAEEREPSGPETVVGRLVQAWPEYEHPAEASARGAEGPLSWVETRDGDVVRLPTDDLGRLGAAPAGATVRVTVGDEVVDEAVRADGLDPAREVLDAEVLAPAPAAPPPASATPPYTNEVTVVLVRPGGVPADRRTVQQVVDAVNGAASDFWGQQSSDTIRIGVTASYDWRSVPATCADPEALWDEAAASVGWTPGTGRHLLVYVPQSAAGCSYGLGEVGYDLLSGGRLYVRDILPSLIAHELGHNFGLGHSSELQCNGHVEYGSCRVTPYNDWYDVMGFSWSRMGSLNAAQADLLGLLPADETVTVRAWDPAGTYTLVPLSSASGTRAVKLVDAVGTAYWLEYRQASGQDSWLGTSDNLPSLQQGVTLRRAEGYPDTSLLLDATPAGVLTWPVDRQVVLPPGRPVKVNRGDFRLTVESVGGTSAVVRVDPGATLVGVRYVATGGPAGPLGEPANWERCLLTGGGCGRIYEHGAIYWSPATGARLVTGAVESRWLALGAERSPLGYPVGDTICGLAGGGCGQHFQKGSLYYGPATGTRVVQGAIRSRWAAQGWEAGPLGYPTTEERCGLAGGGCFQHFQRGSIYWSRATGAHTITGSIRARWAALGWERSPLGYPTTDTVCGLAAGGCAQHFQKGSLYGTTATGVRLASGSIRSRWNASRAQNGPLGYPVTDVRCGLRAGGCFQHFQGGSIYWTPATGARAVAGAIRSAWAAAGWEAGRLGYPVGEVRAVSGGVAQRFQGGILTWNRSTGRVRAS